MKPHYQYLISSSESEDNYDVLHEGHNHIYFTDAILVCDPEKAPECFLEEAHYEAVAALASFAKEAEPYIGSKYTIEQIRAMIAPITHIRISDAHDETFEPVTLAVQDIWLYALNTEDRTLKKYLGLIQEFWPQCQQDGKVPEQQPQSPSELSP